MCGRGVSMTVHGNTSHIVSHNQDFDLNILPSVP